MSFRAVDYLKAGLEGGRVAWQQVNDMLSELYTATPESALPESETTVASAGTTDIGAATTLRVAISGTTTITSFGTTADKMRWLRFTGALVLTHNATSLILPGGANITTAAGDTATVASDGSGNWRVLSYTIAANEPSRLRSKVLSFSRDTATASGSVAYTGVGFRPTSLVFVGAPSASNGLTITGVADSARSGGAWSINSGFTGAVSSATPIILGGNATGQTGTLSSYDSDGFTVAWTKNGSPTGTVVLYALCLR